MSRITQTQQIIVITHSHLTNNSYFPSKLNILSFNKYKMNYYDIRINKK